MSCSSQIVTALGFVTADARIILNRHDLFGSHLAGKPGGAVSPLDVMRAV